MRLTNGYDLLMYRIAGIFRGVKFSWMLGFVVIRGKNIRGRVMSKPHPPYTRITIAFYGIIRG